jgi:hypothetical protein
VAIHETFILPDFKSEAPEQPAVPRLLGLTPITFWMLIGLISFIVIGGAVGGAVGGTIAARKHIDIASGAGTSRYHFLATPPKILVQEF